jgi:hypothetical protein
MVQANMFAGGSGLADSHYFVTELPSTQSNLVQAAALHNLPGDDLLFNRGDTVLSLSDAAPTRNAAELKSLLGDNYARLKPGAAVLPPPSPLPHKLANNSRVPVTVALEQAKPRARVEVDIILESDTCVQGNYLKGWVKLHVHKSAKTQPPVWLAKGRVRVIGYECINDDDRHTFYQCTLPLSSAPSMTEALYIPPADEEGYAEAKEGVHVFPFAILLPLDESCGVAKGVVQSQSGAMVRYIAMASVPLNGFLLTVYLLSVYSLIQIFQGQMSGYKRAIHSTFLSKLRNLASCRPVSRTCCGGETTAGANFQECVPRRKG